MMIFVQELSKKLSAHQQSASGPAVCALQLSDRMKQISASCSEYLPGAYHEADSTVYCVYSVQKNLLH